ncbi:MAG: flagellar motor switch protein FliM [Bacillota bacterium]|jgi:flagellar motor switch protein FliM|nr:flagellar motor switch protein FliM [Bacillota bacterium]
MMMELSPWGMFRGRTVKRYDFRRPDKFSKDQLRTLQIIHESFSRGMATYLSGYVRTIVEGEVVSVTQATYDEFVRSLTNPTLIGVFSVEPLEGNALIEIPPDLSFMIIDRLLGGPGTVPTRIRELTEIEQTVMRRVLERSLVSLGDAWSSLVPMQPRLERVEVNPQFVQLLPPHDMVIVVALRVRIRNVEGRVNICIPYAVLEPIANRLSAHYLFGGGQKVEAGRHVGELRKQVETMTVPVTVTLGEATVTVGELLDLAVGDVIRLNTSTRQLLEVRVGEKTKFLARPGRIGGRLAVEIVEVLPVELGAEAEGVEGRE